MNTLLIIALFGILSSPMLQPSQGTAHREEPNLVAEIPIIRIAAERNGIKYGSDDWYILLAIRLSERGRAGLEFGVMNPKAYNLDLQAAWCGCSIIKARQRWIDAKKPISFIDFMGKRYCPPKAHPLNRHWAKNVKYWFEKLKLLGGKQ